MTKTNCNPEYARASGEYPASGSPAWVAVNFRLGADRRLEWREAFDPPQSDQKPRWSAWKDASKGSSVFSYMRPDQNGRTWLPYERFSGNQKVLDALRNAVGGPPDGPTRLS